MDLPRASARVNNVGWRLNYHCIDPGCLPAVKAAGIEPACSAPIIARSRSSSTSKENAMRIRYNAPVTLTFTFASAIVLILSTTCSRA